MNLIEKRYAEALVEIALKGENIDRFQKELEIITDMYDKHQEFKEFFDDMQIPFKDKKAVIEKSFEGKTADELKNFLVLLAQRKRMDLLTGIKRQFTKIADKRRNLLNIQVFSAFAPEEDQLNGIKMKFMKLYGASACKAEVTIDENLIGGIKIKIGDMVYDASVKAQLNSFRDSLAAE